MISHRATSDAPQHAVLVACAVETPGWLIIAVPVSALAFVRSTTTRRASLHVSAAAPIRRIFLPPADRRGLSLAPLVTRFKERLPDVPIFAAIHASHSGVGVVEMLRAGARPFVWATATEFLSALESGHSNSGGVALPSEDMVAALLSALPGHVLRSVVSHCAALHSSELSIASLSESAGTSGRTFSRTCVRRGWPSPGELLTWIRLIRASLIRLGGEVDEATVAYVGGFSSRTAMHRACARLLGADWHTRHGLAPLAVATALRHRLRRPPASSA